MSESKQKIQRLLGCVCLLASLFVLQSPEVHAQTPEQMHQQGATSENHVHASPLKEHDYSFWDLYKTPETLFSRGYIVNRTFNFVTFAGSLFFAVVFFALLYFVLFNRQGKGKKALYTHGTEKLAKIVVVGLALLVFVVLDVTALWTYFSHADVSNKRGGLMFHPPEEHEALKIQVMPQQWVWNFRYAGEDQIFDTQDDIYTTNELVVPRGKPVILQIKSRDVIHGFWVPQLRTQIDALPGQVTRMWFDVNRNGDFEIVCAHLCGTNHYKMKAFLRVVDPEDYEAWHQEMSEWSEVAFDPDRPQHRWGWSWGL